MNLSVTRHDLREGGRWRLRQWLKNSLIYCVIRAGLHILDRIDPLRLQRWGRYAGQLVHALFARARSRARENITAALPGVDAPALAKQCFVNAGENLALCLLLRRSSIKALDFVEVDAAARRLLENTLQEGPGAVFISAHLGPFELLAAAVAELGLRPAVVVRQSYDPRLDAVVDAHRQARGVEVFHRGAPGTSLRILRALRRGRPVGFLIDLPARVPSYKTHFLGREQAVPIGPQLLALRGATPLLIGTLAPAENTSHRFRLVLRHLAPISRDPAELTQRVSGALAERVLAMPAHWLWMGV